MSLSKYLVDITDLDSPSREKAIAVLNDYFWTNDIADGLFRYVAWCDEKENPSKFPLPDGVTITPL
mgnify:CR=1 FL=1